MQDEDSTRLADRHGDIAWCPGCDFEAPIEVLSVEVMTFWRCPRCQWQLQSLPADASEEYREQVRRYR